MHGKRCEMGAGNRCGDGAEDVRRQHDGRRKEVGRTCDGHVQVMIRGYSKCWEGLSMKSRGGLKDVLWGCRRGVISG